MSILIKISYFNLVFDNLDTVLSENVFLHTEHFHQTQLLSENNGKNASQTCWSSLKSNKIPDLLNQSRKKNLIKQ